MPVFNGRIGGESQDQQGNIITLQPSEAMRHVGPIMPVILTPLGASPQQSGDTALSVSGQALIDTGAMTTCVDAEAAKQVGLAIVGSGYINSATHADQEVPIFAGSLHIEGASMAAEFTQAFGANLAAHQGIVALIGRDLLSRCVLVYNGPDDSFSLSI